MVRRGEIARWPWGPDRVGAPFAIERAAIPGGANNGSAKNGGSIHDWAVRRVETAQIGLKRTPGSRLAPHRAQNGAPPGYRAILHGECALGALNDLFGFPSGSVRVGGHAPAQGVHPSAVKAPCARNADLPVGRSLSTTPSPKPHVPQSAGVRAEGPRPVWVELTSGQGIFNFVTRVGRERDYQDGRCLPRASHTAFPRSAFGGTVASYRPPPPCSPIRNRDTG